MKAKQMTIVALVAVFGIVAGILEAADSPAANRGYVTLTVGSKGQTIRVPTAVSQPAAGRQACMTHKSVAVRLPQGGVVARNETICPYVKHQMACKCQHDPKLANHCAD